MPRYFFHVEDGVSPADDEGAELANLPAARREATDLAGRVMQHSAGRFWDGQPWSVHVTDERGLVLFVLEMTAHSAPSTASYQKPLG